MGTTTEVPNFENMSIQEALDHAGIKGMKWGVRRPIGPNGLVVRTGKPQQTATNKAGKANAGKRQNEKPKSNKIEPKKPTGKPKETMTTEELREAVARLQLEKQYASLRSELTPKQNNEFKKAMKKGVMDAGTEFTKAMMIKGMQGAANMAAKKISGNKLF